MEFNNTHIERGITPQRFKVFGVLSVAAHGLIFLFLFLWAGRMPSAMIIASGEGEGGDGGGGGAIQIGIITAKELGFALPKKVSYLGDDPNETINNERLQQVAEPETAEDALLLEKKKLDEEARKTNLPVPTKEERLYSAKPKRGSSSETTASVGTSYGSPKPTIQGGIGIGTGDGSGLGTGLPGGSEYGRRIKNILSRNFTPPNISVNGVSNVVIYVKIARDGRVTSVISGRVPRQFFKQSSQYDQLNYAAERAVIATALQGLPPFPAGFLSGIQEAVAEVWFQYP